VSLEIVQPVEAMALLEALLRRREASFPVTAPSIQFDFGSEIWSFDPRRQGSYVSPGPVAEAALTITCSGAVLGRLFLNPDFFLAPGEQLKLVGDRHALAPLIAALEADSAKNA
jgi:hypothetical protein